MAEPFTDPVVDYRAVAKVAKRSHLRDVRLAWSQVGVFTDPSTIAPKWYERAFVGFDSGASPLEAGADRLEVHCSFFCWFKDGLDPTDGDQPPEFDRENPPDVAIEAAMELVYGISNADDMSDAALDDFAVANGTHNAWPYWREFVQSMTLRLGITPYLIGPFKLPASRGSADGEGKPPSPAQESRRGGRAT